MASRSVSEMPRRASRLAGSTENVAPLDGDAEGDFTHHVPAIRNQLFYPLRRAAYHGLAKHQGGVVSVAPLA
eukprot:scaffold13609_cov106-Isochrysis_galbana.AAC.3